MSPSISTALSALCSSYAFGLLTMLCACTENIRLPGATDASIHMQPDTAPADASDGSASISTGNVDAAMTMAPQPACPAALNAADGVRTSASKSQCLGLASALFRHALCTCNDLTVQAPLKSDAFDSSVAPYAPGQAGGGLGTNGRLTVTTALELLGSLTVADSEATVLTAGPVHITDNVKVNADLIINTADVMLGRDLLVNGRIVAALSTLRVGRAIQQPSDRSNTGDIVAADGFERRTPSISEPCACDSPSWIDFNQLAASFAAQSDNMRAGVRTGAFRSALPLDLGCGRYVAEAGRFGPTRWTISGAVSVFIDGDLELTGRLEVQIAEQSSLDVYVRGALVLGPLAEVLSARPGALRVFVQGASDLQLADGARFECSLFAPTSQLSLAGEPALQGALVLGNFTSTAAVSLHYDAAVLRPQGAPACEEHACTADNDCADPALCIDSKCALVH